MYKVDLAPVGDDLFYAYVIPVYYGSEVWIFCAGYGVVYFSYGVDRQILASEVRDLDASGYFDAEKQLLLCEF